MSIQLTVTLPDKIHQRTQYLAELTGRSLEEILGAMLELSLSPFVPQIDLDQPVTALSDMDVIALTGLQMQPEQDCHLSQLLDQKKSAPLSETEQAELERLMHVYEIGMVYKSQALAEAVHRGLREPLTL
ncbi:MAG: hypothetical protein K8L97_01465 [Anaerolineae bacterium]|nr:hypothetical protein [Anaerolineae bacterium]